MSVGVSIDLSVAEDCQTWQNTVRHGLRTIRSIVWTLKHG